MFTTYIKTLLCSSYVKRWTGCYSLSRLLGHEDITITKRYLQSIQDDSIIELATNTSPLMSIKVASR